MAWGPSVAVPMSIALREAGGKSLHPLRGQKAFPVGTVDKVFHSSILQGQYHCPHSFIQQVFIEHLPCSKYFSTSRVPL